MVLAISASVIEALKRWKLYDITSVWLLMYSSLTHFSLMVSPRGGTAFCLSTVVQRAGLRGWLETGDLSLTYLIHALKHRLLNISPFMRSQNQLFMDWLLR